MEKSEFLKRVEKASKKLKKQRGDVIHNAIDIEDGIAKIIMHYYIKDEKHDEFLMKCMLDDYFSFGLKIRIFQKTFRKEPYKGFFEEIKRLNSIRNIFAHSPMANLSGDLAHRDKDLRFKIKKSKELYDEFYRLHKKLLEELNKLLKTLIK